MFDAERVQEWHMLANESYDGTALSGVVEPYRRAMREMLTVIVAMNDALEATQLTHPCAVSGSEEDCVEQTGGCCGGDCSSKCHEDMNDLGDET